MTRAPKPPAPRKTAKKAAAKQPKAKPAKKPKSRASVIHAPVPKSRKTKIRHNRKGEGAARIAAYSLEQICSDLSAGISMTDIAQKQIGVDITTLSRWLSSDPQRSACARAARISAAAAWDEAAATVIKEAKSKFQLDKARELASHFRWRASKLAPKEYGDRVAHEHEGEVVVLTPEQRRLRIEALIAKVTLPSAAVSHAPAAPAMIEHKADGGS